MKNSTIHNAWKSMPRPHDITRTTFPNGITLLCRPNFSSPSVYLTGYLTTGSIQDPPQKLGLANFTARSLMRGTQKRTFQQIYQELETIGASMGFEANVHTSSFSARALTEDLPLILDLLSQALRFPLFPEEHISKVRAQLLTSLAMRAQDTAEMASLEFDRLLFPDHPYGRPEDGFPETVAGIQAEELAAFHGKYYKPNGMVLVIVGGIAAETALDLVAAQYGDWQPDAMPEAFDTPSVLPPEKPARSHITIPGMSQTDLVLGALGPARTSPDYIPAALGNNILGQFGMMGRIGDVVREKAGLAYYASTSLNAWMHVGSWEVSAGVNPQNLQKAIDLIISEIQRFVQEPVSAEELSDSQSNFIGRLPLLMESNGGVGNALVNIERFNLGLDYYQQYANQVRRVTAEDVLDVARRYLNPDALIITSAGVAE